MVSLVITDPRILFENIKIGAMIYWLKESYEARIRHQRITVAKINEIYTETNELECQDLNTKGLYIIRPLLEHFSEIEIFPKNTLLFLKQAQKLYYNGEDVTDEILEFFKETLFYLMDTMHYQAKVLKLLRNNELLHDLENVITKD